MLAIFTGVVQDRDGCIAGRNVVLRCFMYAENSLMHWWRNGTAVVISYAVALKVRPCRSVVLNQALSMCFIVFQSVLR
jgi:hypothetical protein